MGKKKRPRSIMDDIDERPRSHPSEHPPKRKVTCPWCMGDGKERRYDAKLKRVPCDEKCYTCGGTGLAEPEDE